VSGRIRGVVLVMAAVGGALVAGCSTPSRSSASGSSVTTVAVHAPTTVAVHAPTTPSSGVVCGIVPGPDVTVTNSGGCAVRATLGADIEVELGSSMRWSNPSSDSAAVTVVSTDKPAAGGLDATLRASALGQATVSADGVAVCNPGEACPALAELWRVMITVT
jgi:hypothetical protein